MIRPLAGRVLIKPDTQAKETASGLAIPDSHFEYDMSGRVVQIGDGPASAHNVRREVLRRVYNVLQKTGASQDVLMVIERMRCHVGYHSELKEGDHVAFPYTAGTVMDVDGERYLLMNEDQIVAVLEAE